MDYDNKAVDSDLDAFKNAGQILTRAITLNTTLGPGAQQFFRASPAVGVSPDFFEILYDNSVYHPGRFKPLNLAPHTAMPDSITFGGDGSCYLFTEVDGNEIVVGVWVFNPYDSNLSIGPVTYNFRFIPFEATF